MLRIGTALFSWLIIVGVLIVLALGAVVSLGARLWRYAELYLIYRGNRTAQEKADWHMS